jgi:hypothetical protein
LATASALGRAPIGLGIAAALMAGLKAIVLWFPEDRVALINRWFVMLGALGALTATAPAEMMLQWTGWRGLSAGTRHLAAASVSVSAAGAHNSPRGLGWRTVSACNIQDSTRRARATASVFGEERLDAECNCHPRHREVFDRESSTRQTWLSDPRSFLKSIWNLLSIVCSPSSYSRASWLKSNPVTVKDTQIRLHDLTSEGHVFCLMSRLTVDHPVVAAKVFSLLSDAFPNTLQRELETMRAA